MITYPTLSYGATYDSSETTLDDLQIDRATNGAVRIRAQYTEPKKQFVVVHSGCTLADKATMVAFYLANRVPAYAAKIDFVWAADGEHYHCYLAAPIQYVPEPGQRWKITVTLVQA